MATYKELLEQQKELDRQIADARAKEISGAVQSIRELIAEYQLTEQDLFATRRGEGRGGVEKPAKAKVAPKYRNDATGDTWTGRGKAPRWLDGQNRENFLIEKAE